MAFDGLPDSQKTLATARTFSSVEQAATVDAATPVLRDRIKPDGVIWMSWPKKASKVPTDVTENVIRDRALADALVDVKVCAVDDVWSGLKLVVRKELRAAHINA